jgi:hypothetical protein
MSIKKTLPFAFCAVLMAAAPFLSSYKPPAQYTITLNPTGMSLLLRAVSASNGIDGDKRVQLLDLMNEQLVQQDQAWVKQDSIRNKPKK